MVSFWYSVPSFAAVAAGGAIFLLCKDIKRFHKYMAFALIFEGLFLMLAGVIFTGMTRFYLPTYLLYSVMMLISPFFYYFASISFLKREGIHRKDFWMPEIVAMFALVLLFVINVIPAPDRDAFLYITRGGNADITTGTSVMLSLDNFALLTYLIELLFVQIFCFINLSRYNKLLEEYYSNLKGKSSGKVAVIFSLVSLRYIILLCLASVPYLASSSLFHIVMTVVSVIFYGAIAFYVCTIRHTAEEIAQLITMEEQRQSRENRLPMANEAIAARLATLVKEKFFLNPEIDLITVSTKVQVNSKYLSEFLKYHYGETFLAYVNHLRIDHSISLLTDRNLQLTDIAELSGFSSVSAYYRNFMKIKGISPSEYRKK